MPISNFLKTWIFLLNIVARQVNFNGTKIQNRLKLRFGQHWIFGTKNNRTVWITVASNIGGFKLCKQKSPTYFTFFTEIWREKKIDIFPTLLFFLSKSSIIYRRNRKYEKKSIEKWTCQNSALMYKLREFWMECCVGFKYFWSGSL